jgi:hypothetical protein
MILQNCIMCDEENIHWFCSKCEKRFSIHHPSVMKKIENHRVQLELKKHLSEYVIVL